MNTLRKAMEMHTLNDSGLVISSVGRKELTLYFGLTLSGARFIPTGDDLLMIDPHNQQVVLKGYFTNPLPPTLHDIYGTTITPDDVTKQCHNLQSVARQSFKPFDVTSTIEVFFGAAAHIPPSAFRLPSLMSAQECYFTIISQGRAGLLTIDNMVLQTGDAIGWHDIAQGKLIYYHDESSHDPDALYLKAFDPNSGQEVEVTIPVQIKNQLMG
jgi:hypothetical protein